MVIEERRDSFGELFGGLDKRKMTSAVEHAQRGIWHVLHEPLHMGTVWISAPDDEQGRHVESSNVFPKIVPGQLARERRRVCLDQKLERLEI